MKFQIFRHETGEGGEREPNKTARRLKRQFIALSAASFIWASLGSAAETPADAQRPQPAPQRVTVPKLRGAITLDGELTEDVWRSAALLTFQKNDGSGPGSEPTELRLWYDNRALYLGWTCTDSDIQATFTNRDSKFWEEEVVEMFVTAGPLTRYFELQWNPLNGVFDAIITNHLDAQGMSKDFQGDWSFTAREMRSKVKVTGTVGHSDDRDTRWQVEVILPFSDLGRSTAPTGETWRANFYRFNRTRGAPVEMLSWSPTRDPSFHQPSRFGYVQFGK